MNDDRSRNQFTANAEQHGDNTQAPVQVVEESSGGTSGETLVRATIQETLESIIPTSAEEVVVHTGVVANNPEPYPMEVQSVSTEDKRGGKRGDNDRRENYHSEKIRSDMNQVVTDQSATIFPQQLHADNHVEEVGPLLHVESGQVAPITYSRPSTWKKRARGSGGHGVSIQEPSQMRNGNGKRALEQGDVIQDGDVTQELRVKRRQLSGVFRPHGPFIRYYGEYIGTTNYTTAP
ncbi:hypothetical protein FCV25MIE_28650 [Fagus crenata]